MASIPKTQLAATVPKQRIPIKVEFVEDYPVPEPKQDEVLVKVLYTGVCQSDLHTAAGTATGADGKLITKSSSHLHVGGHEGVGRIVAFGPDTSPSKDIDFGTLVGIQFLSTVCHECEFCTTGREQHCGNATNHLHHEDGSFQEYYVLNTNYLTLLPQDIDPKVIGPVLCAGLTAYKAVKNTSLKPGEWLCVIGAGGGLGHLAVQYGLAAGAKVLGIDAGESKRSFIESLGAQFLDFTKSPNLVQDVMSITSGGSHGAVVTSGHPAAFTHAADILRIGGALSLVGIPPGDVHLKTPIAKIVIKGLRVTGNLVGSMRETLESVELVECGKVKPHVEIRKLRDLPVVYDMLEKGDISGRAVLQVSTD